MRRSWLLPAACLDEAPGRDLLATSLWLEKSTGYDSGALRPVRFTILATGGDEAGGLRDAGLIVVRGRPQGRP
ncbi:MAG: hypothetical protein MIN69_18775 [Methylorubrum extorquens]|uniref:Uncharacterized protein n=1 Tax=Methylorubrum extorquens (strain DSM 6343 / CIP 106787 / DM4) TaxID=661410 RepID=C7CLF4_METED|nr:hypothetical protein [Methylorubrum extorquens]CAX24783.1 protein of unknown function [Methylorubrum extorquens DM4]